MDRRTLLKTGGAALVGFGFSGCATLKGAPTTRPRVRVNLPPIEASWDRVIRTTVGLRPHRPSGFMLKAEKLDAKTLVHNYGHGGSGHSLGWGTGAMAADLALQQPDRRVAVIGCGTVGLTAARQLQRRGFDVTIYTKAVPPGTTSNMALAQFSPASGLISGARTPEWDAQFRQAVEIAYRQLQLLAGSRYGISWIHNYNMTDTLPTGGPGTLEPSVTGLMPPGVPELEPDRVVLGPGEHPFPTKYALRRSQMRIEPGLYLDALLHDFHEYGGRVVVRAFDAPRDLMTLGESVIVNCSGLGSRDLFSDQTMMPVKGQLSILVPQPEVNYSLSGGGARTGGLRSSAMPRSDGIALGGTMERGVWTIEPNEEARKRIVDAAVAVFGAVRGFSADRPISRSVAPSTVPSVESFFGEEEF